MSLKKHVKTNPVEISYNETISTFMHQFKLKHLGQEYKKKFFKIYGLNKERAGLFEKMIQRPYNILRVLE